MSETSTTGKSIDQGGVDHPSHYNMDASGVECIEVVRHLDFNLGSAYKYVFRAGQKYEGDDPSAYLLKDLKKALWYVNDELALNLEYRSGFDVDVAQKMYLVYNSREGNARKFFEFVYMIYATRGYNYKEFLTLCAEHIEAEIKGIEKPVISDPYTQLRIREGQAVYDKLVGVPDDVDPTNPVTKEYIRAAITRLQALIGEEEKGEFCNQCAGPYEGWPGTQYSGHWDTCANRVPTPGYSHPTAKPKDLTAQEAREKGYIRAPTQEEVAEAVDMLKGLFGASFTPAEGILAEKISDKTTTTKVVVFETVGSNTLYCTECKFDMDDSARQGHMDHAHPGNSSRLEAPGK